MSTSSNKWYNFFVFKKSSLFLFLIVICLIVAAILGAKTPTLITNLSKSYQDYSLFNAAIVALFLNFLGVYLNRVCYQLLINKYVRMLIQNARLNSYTKWLTASELQSEKYPQGEIISRIMSDTEAIRELITSGAFGIFIDLSFVVSCLFGFIKLHKFTGVFISFSEVAATLFLFWGSSLMRDMFLKLRNSQAKVNRVTANVVGGFSQMYYTNHSGYAVSKSAASFDEFLDNQHKVNSMDAFYYAIAESLYPILLSLVVFVFPYSKITEAALIFAIVDLIQRSINPIKEISGKIANIQRAKTGVDRIINFLNDLTFEKNINQKELNFNQFEKLEVSIDQFTYPHRSNEENKIPFSLQNIKFEGKGGDLIGIVGLSGSGKSTLLNLLAGTIKSKDSNVKIYYKEGIISSLDEISYSKKVSLVSQDSHIFTESLKFNITMSFEEDLNFHERYENFKQQIPYLKAWGISPEDKIIPSKLSLGQRQLIAGIRSLYLNKDIVFFDEISSALDPELELSLRKMILLIQEHSLTIIVAHRIETIMQANNILVMENGRVIQSGKHEILMTNSEVYQKFIEELSHY